MIGGSGEIRTHGPFRADSFQDCCNKPDSATLPNLVEITGIEPVVPEGGGFTVHCITIDASSPFVGAQGETRTLNPCGSGF
jgi:hypothetical protein